MTATTLFYIFIAILVISFIFDKIIDTLNSKRFDATIPDELSDVYELEAYKKSQAYKKTNATFSNLASFFSLLLTLAFFFFDGFKFVDEFARNYSKNEIVIPLIFFGIIMLGSSILTLPFSYYKTFVIEEKFGFNKSTKATYFIDKVKGMFMTVLLGGGILSAIIWLYQLAGNQFWLYAWGLITTFSLIMNLFYSKLIVTLFNKQNPL